MCPLRANLANSSGRIWPISGRVWPKATHIWSIAGNLPNMRADPTKSRELVAMARLAPDTGEDP